MNKILENIFETQEFTDSQGNAIKIHSETPRGQCEFLQRLILQNGFKNAVEVGLAYGTSTVAIAEAVSHNSGHSVAIDPYERTYWKGIGLELVHATGHEVEFIDDYSYRALPRLIEQGRRFDFAYIDSTKLTDWLMTDFFLIDTMLVNQGIIVFDDVNYPSIRKLVRYIAQLPHYEVVGRWPDNKGSAIRKIVKNRLTLGRFDGPTAKDYHLGIYGRSVALRKTGDDARSHDWHTRF